MNTHRTKISPGPKAPHKGTACVIVIYGEGLGRRLAVGAQHALIGRTGEADLQLPHASVSRRHCVIWSDGKQHYIRDLGSTNRTRVNEQELDGQDHRLSDGDHITVGESILKFVGPASIEAPYHDEVFQQATHDPLTGLGNRRYFEDVLERERSRTSRHERPLSLCMIDIDHFKKVNDTWGHASGDEVLQRVARTIREHARNEDTAARVGGEEFTLLLPEADLEEARKICERLRQAVAELPFTFEGQAHAITISLGIAGCRPGDDPQQLFQRADEALYKAKESGRNKVCQAD